MKRKGILKISSLVVLGGIIVAVGIVYYMFNMPHRDVIGSPPDMRLSAIELVNEYIQDPQAANTKYLSEDGNSKIIEVKGFITSIEEDFNNQKVVTLSSSENLPGVSFTFTETTNNQTLLFLIGHLVTLKGVIRSGPYYDKDMGFWEPIILEKASISNDLSKK